MIYDLSKLNNNLYILLLLSICIFISLFKILINYYKKRKKKLFYINSGIKTVDMMKGIEFESFLLAHFEKLGYKVKLTKKSNDYGADLLLRKKGRIIVVQAKRYSKKVGIKAVQELVASLKYYKASEGIVITNNYFTKNAINLAKVNCVELWDRKKLTTIMQKNNCKKLADNIIDQTNESKICPICGGNLILKNGMYGAFWGCSNYPKCRFIRKIK
jgi:restriction system protein